MSHCRHLPIGRPGTVSTRASGGDRLWQPSSDECLQRLLDVLSQQPDAFHDGEHTAVRCDRQKNVAAASFPERVKAGPEPAFLFGKSVFLANREERIQFEALSRALFSRAMLRHAKTPEAPQGPFRCCSR